MTKTFDDKKLMQPYGLKEIDEAFFNWWDKKLDLHLVTKDGIKQKVPVMFVSTERWLLAREEGIRDRHGTIILPVIAISRTRIGGPNEGALSRIAADTKSPMAYSVKINKKSSLIKELVEERGWTLDPSLPIYEVYTTRTPNHMSLQYEVAIWTQHVEQMNEIIAKIGLEYDYLSVKSFAFDKKDENGYFVAFEDDELTDESNLDDYSDSERIIRKSFGYSVPGYIMPESDERKSSFRRYLSQTKLVFKTQTVLTSEEFEKIYGDE